MIGPRTAAALVLVSLCCLAGAAWADDNKKACADAYVAAQTLRGDHKLMASREQLRICTRDACKPFMGGGIVKDCTQWLSQVEGLIASVVLSVHDASGAAVTDVQVSMDGAQITSKIDTRAIDVEPGPHTFGFQAKDGSTAERSVLVIEGQKSQAVSVQLTRPSKTPLAQTTGSTATGVLSHTPPGEGLVHAPLAVSIDYAGSATLAWVFVRFKGAGMGSWLSTALRKLAAGRSAFGGYIPCAEVNVGSMQYFIEGYDVAHDLVASAGSADKPFSVAISTQLTGALPSLPGLGPPVCSEATSCLPAFPSCNGETVVKRGYELGEACVDDDECLSGLCSGSKCARLRAGRLIKIGLESAAPVSSGRPEA